MIQNDDELHLEINSFIENRYSIKEKNQASNVNFVINFAYQEVVWKGISQKSTLFLRLGRLHIHTSCIRFSPQSKNETGTHFKRFLREESLQIGSRWMLLWWSYRKIQELQQWTVNVEDIMPAGNLMISIVTSFDGNADKFYPRFYKNFYWRNL